VRYFKDGEFLNVACPKRASYTWKGIIHGRNLLREGLVWRIVNGESIRSLMTIGYHDLEFNIHWDASKMSAPSVYVILSLTKGVHGMGTSLRPTLSLSTWLIS
jgi:hypothetical protein